MDARCTVAIAFIASRVGYCKASCTACRRRSSVGCRWFWTLLPVWSSVLASFSTSPQFFVMCFIGCQCASGSFIRWPIIAQRKCVIPHSTMKNTLCKVIECCNNIITLTRGCHAGKHMIHACIHRLLCWLVQCHTVYKKYAHGMENCNR